MSPQKQRIAIAEFSGHDIGLLDVCKCGEERKYGHEHGFFPMMDIADLPDYLNDLNAMHEAEKRLPITLPEIPHTESVRTRYVVKLEEMCGSKGMVLATAAQRAEALLRTIGKWVDP